MNFNEAIIAAVSGSLIIRKINTNEMIKVWHAGNNIVRGQWEGFRFKSTFDIDISEDYEFLKNLIYRELDKLSMPLNLRSEVIYQVLKIKKELSDAN